ncbi:unnamed protein product, partial [Darwinula stevensoni]
MNGVLLEDEDLSDVDDHIFLNGNGDGKGDHGKDDLAKPLMPPRKKSQTENGNLPLMETRIRRPARAPCRAWCTPICYLLLALSALFGILGIGVYVMEYLNDSVAVPSWMKFRHSCTSLKKETRWTLTLPKYGSLIMEADSQRDLLFLGASSGLDSVQGTAEGNALLCDIYFEGNQPCRGSIIGVNASDGQVLWRQGTQNHIQQLSCKTDVSGDNIDVLGVNGKDGTIIWEFSSSSIMHIVQVRDWDGDSVPDVLVLPTESSEASSLSFSVLLWVLSGHAVLSLSEPEGRRKGKKRKRRWFLLSGSNGRKLHESRMNVEGSLHPPVTLVHPDETEYLLFTSSYPARISIFQLEDFIGDKGGYRTLLLGVNGTSGPIQLGDLNGDGIEDFSINVDNATLAFDGWDFSPMWTSPLHSMDGNMSLGHFVGEKGLDIFFLQDSQALVVGGRNGSGEVVSGELAKLGQFFSSAAGVISLGPSVDGILFWLASWKEHDFHLVGWSRDFVPQFQSYLNVSSQWPEHPNETESLGEKYLEKHPGALKLWEKAQHGKEEVQPMVYQSKHHISKYGQSREMGNQWVDPYQDLSGVNERWFEYDNEEPDPIYGLESPDADIQPDWLGWKRDVKRSIQIEKVEREVLPVLVLPSTDAGGVDVISGVTSQAQRNCPQANNTVLMAACLIAHGRLHVVAGLEAKCVMDRTLKVNFTSGANQGNSLNISLEVDTGKKGELSQKLREVQQKCNDHLTSVILKAASGNANGGKDSSALEDGDEDDSDDDKVNDKDQWTLPEGLDQDNEKWTSLIELIKTSHEIPDHGIAQVIKSCESGVKKWDKYATHVIFELLAREENRHGLRRALETDEDLNTLLHCDEGALALKLARLSLARKMPPLAILQSEWEKWLELGHWDSLKLFFSRQPWSQLRPGFIIWYFLSCSSPETMDLLLQTLWHPYDNEDVEKEAKSICDALASQIKCLHWIQSHLETSDRSHFPSITPMEILSLVLSSRPLRALHQIFKLENLSLHDGLEYLKLSRESGDGDNKNILLGFWSVRLSLQALKASSALLGDEGRYQEEVTDRLLLAKSYTLQISQLAFRVDVARLLFSLLLMEKVETEKGLHGRGHYLSNASFTRDLLHVLKDILVVTSSALFSETKSKDEEDGKSPLDSQHLTSKLLQWVNEAQWRLSLVTEEDFPKEMGIVDMYPLDHVAVLEHLFAKPEDLLFFCLHIQRDRIKASQVVKLCDLGETWLGHETSFDEFWEEAKQKVLLKNLNVEEFLNAFQKETPPIQPEVEELLPGLKVSSELKTSLALFDLTLALPPSHGSASILLHQIEEMLSRCDIPVLLSPWRQFFTQYFTLIHELRRLPDAHILGHPLLLPLSLDPQKHLCGLGETWLGHETSFDEFWEEAKQKVLLKNLNVEEFLNAFQKETPPIQPEVEELLPGLKVSSELKTSLALFDLTLALPPSHGSVSTLLHQIEEMLSRCDIPVLLSPWRQFFTQYFTLIHELRRLPDAHILGHPLLLPLSLDPQKHVTLTKATMSLSVALRNFNASAQSVQSEMQIFRRLVEAVGDMHSTLRRLSLCPEGGMEFNPLRNIMFFVKQMTFLLNGGRKKVKDASFAVLRRDIVKSLGEVLLSRPGCLVQITHCAEQLNLDLAYVIVRSSVPAIPLHVPTTPVEPDEAAEVIRLLLDFTLNQEDSSESSLEDKKEEGEWSQLHKLPDELLDYLRSESWLVSFLLEKLHSDRSSADGIPSSYGSPCLDRLFLSPRSNVLKIFFSGSRHLAALSPPPASQMIILFIKEHAKSPDVCLELLDSIPPVCLSEGLLQIRDALWCHCLELNLIPQGLKPWQAVLQIRDPELRCATLLKCARDWPYNDARHAVVACIPLSTAQFKEELQSIRDEVQLYQQVLEALKEGAYPDWQDASWQDIAKRSQTDSSSIFGTLYSLRKYSVASKWAERHSLPENLHRHLEESLLRSIITSPKPDPHQIKAVLVPLSSTVAASILENLLPEVEHGETCSFLVSLLLDEYAEVLSPVKKEQYTRLLTGLGILMALDGSYRPELLDIVQHPLLMIEQLIMNMEVKAAKTALMKLNVDNKRLSTDWKSSVNLLVLSYADKSLWFHPSFSGGSTGSPSDLEASLNGSVGSGSCSYSHSSFVPPTIPPQKSKWIPDKKADRCMECGTEPFSMFHRRHHCRRCGRVVCFSCSQHRILVEGYGNVEVRVCDPCFKFSTAEQVPGDQPPDSVELHLPKPHRWKLSQDPEYNEVAREEFSFEYYPNVPLCLSLLELCHDSQSAADFLISKAMHYFAFLRPLAPGHVNPEIDLEVLLKIISDLLLAAKLKLEGRRASDCDRLLDLVDLAHLIVDSGCAHLLPSDWQGDMANSVRRLRDSLVREERYGVALDVSTRAQLDRTSVFAAWGLSCLNAGDFETAREKFSSCLTKDPPRLQGNRKLLEQILGYLQSRPFLVDENVMEGARRSRAALGSKMPLMALHVQHSLASLQDIMNGKMKEARGGMEPLFFTEAMWYLTTYAPADMIVTFYQQHGMLKEAVEFCANMQINSDVFFASLFLPCIKQGKLSPLLHELRSFDSSLISWKKCLEGACRQLELRRLFHVLYELQIFLQDHVRASMTCLQFYVARANSFSELVQRSHHLEHAKEHLERYLFKWTPWKGGAREKQEEAPLILHLSLEDINHQLSLIQLQANLMQFLSNHETLHLDAAMNCVAPENKQPPTLFGMPEQSVVVAAITLLAPPSILKGFPLCLRLMQERTLSWRDVMVKATTGLVRMKRVPELQEFILGIQKHCTDGNAESLRDVTLEAAVRAIRDEKRMEEVDQVIRLSNSAKTKVNYSLTAC